MARRSDAEVEEAVATAQQEAAPIGSEEDWCAISTRELRERSIGEGGSFLAMSITYLEAIREAQAKLSAR